MIVLTAEILLRECSCLNSRHANTSRHGFFSRLVLPLRHHQSLVRIMASSGLVSFDSDLETSVIAAEILLKEYGYLDSRYASIIRCGFMS